MTISTIDPVAALIVVDLQAGIVSVAAQPHPVGTVVANSARLAEAFRAHGLPVVLVNVDGGAPGRTEAGRGGGAARPEGWTELLSELGRAEDDILVTKRTWGAFQGTRLHEELKARGVTQVFVTGIATSAGVESTARSAHEHGYNVVVVDDASADRDAASHEHSVTRVFPRLGEVGSTEEVIALLDAR